MNKKLTLGRARLVFSPSGGRGVGGLWDLVGIGMTMSRRRTRRTIVACTAIVVGIVGGIVVVIIGAGGIGGVVVVATAPVFGIAMPRGLSGGEFFIPDRRRRRRRCHRRRRRRRVHGGSGRREIILVPSFPFDLVLICPPLLPTAHLVLDGATGRSEVLPPPQFVGGDE